VSYYINCPACAEQPDLPDSWYTAITLLRNQELNV
jgi:hypothetical protein